MNWFVWALMAMAVWGLWAFLPRYKGALDEPSFLVFQALGSLMVAVGILCWQKFRPQFELQGGLSALAVGALALVGMMFFLKALHSGQASSAQVICTATLYPLVAVLLALLIHREIPSVQQGIALCLSVLVIVLLATDKPQKSVSPEKKSESLTSTEL